MRKLLCAIAVSTLALVNLGPSAMAYEGGVLKPHSHSNLASGGNVLNPQVITVSSLTVTGNKFSVGTSTFSIQNGTVFIGSTTGSSFLKTGLVVWVDSNTGIFPESLTFKSNNVNTGDYGDQVDSQTIGGIQPFSSMEGGLMMFTVAEGSTALRNLAIVSTAIPANLGNTAGTTPPIWIQSNVIHAPDAPCSNCSGSINNKAPLWGLANYTNFKYWITGEGSSYQMGDLIVYGTASIRGITSGLATPTGFVGEFLSNNLGAPQVPNASNQYVALATITLTAGDWDITASIELGTGGTTAATLLIGCISSGNTSCDTNNSNNVLYDGDITRVSDNYKFSIGPRRVNITSTTPYYLTGNLVYTVLGGAQYNVSSIIQARRMH